MKSKYWWLSRWLSSKIMFEIWPTVNNYMRFISQHYQIVIADDINNFTSPQDYLDFEKIRIEKLLKNAEYFSREEKVYTNIIKFLENNDSKSVIVDFLANEPVSFKNAEKCLIEKKTTEPLQKSFEGRTYIIALQIDFELLDKSSDYLTLIESTSQTVKLINDRFKSNVTFYKIKKIKRFVHSDIKKSRSNFKGQIKSMYLNVIDNPAIFGERVALRCKEIYDSYFP